MKERSVPLNFITPCLWKPLEEKRVCATVRSRGFVRRYGLKPGVKVEVKYKRKRVGFAVVTAVETIGYKELNDPNVFRKAGFVSSTDFVEVVKGFFVWQWKRVEAGKKKLYFIEFEWI